jgi:hypothetical protein
MGHADVQPEGVQDLAHHRRKRDLIVDDQDPAPAAIPR